MHYLIAECMRGLDNKIPVYMNTPTVIRVSMYSFLCLLKHFVISIGWSSIFEWLVHFYRHVHYNLQHYSNNDECSEVCQCTMNGSLTCRVLACGPKMPCTITKGHMYGKLYMNIIFNIHGAYLHVTSHIMKVNIFYYSPWDVIHRTRERHV